MARAVKTETELLELHRRLVKKHLTEQTGYPSKVIRLILKLYDKCINTDNIIHYYFRNTKVFTIALITDRLNEIADYTRKIETIEIDED